MYKDIGRRKLLVSAFAPRPLYVSGVFKNSTMYVPYIIVNAVLDTKQCFIIIYSVGLYFVPGGKIGLRLNNHGCKECQVLFVLVHLSWSPEFPGGPSHCLPDANRLVYFIEIS